MKIRAIVKYPVGYSSIDVQNYEGKCSVFELNKKEDKKYWSYVIGSCYCSFEEALSKFQPSFIFEYDHNHKTEFHFEESHLNDDISKILL